MYSAVYYHRTVRAAEVMAQSAVERSPSFPDRTASSFGLTDGELLVQLQGEGGRAAELVARLLGRRLYKRAWGLRRTPAATRSRWDRLARRPKARRSMEDELAGTLGLEPGELLLDLAGVAHRSPAADEWGRVEVLEDERPVHPFRRPGPWQALALRPPTLWAVSAYVVPERLELARRRLGRAVDRQLG
jgi:HD superfamily phosphohydrolase